MDARQVGLGASLLAASGVILIATGAKGGRLLLSLAGVGVPGLLASGVRDLFAERNWPV